MSSRGSFELIPPRPKVVFMGTGPGDPGLLTMRAADILARANFVVYETGVHCEILEAYVGPSVERMLADEVGANPTTRGRKLGELANQHGLVVRLMSGDGMLFAPSGAEAAAVKRAGVLFEMTPGVGFSSAVSSYAGTPLTTTRVRSVRYIEASPSTHTDVSKHRNTVHVLTGNYTQTTQAVESLLADGWDPATQVVSVIYPTRVQQLTFDTTLAELPKALQENADAHESITTLLGAGVESRGALSWFEAKPLFGWRVLIPRTKEQGISTAEVLQEYGADSTIVPTIAIQPPRTPGQLEKAIRGLVDGDYQWVGFTSVNAVRAIRIWFKDLGLDTRSLAGVKVAAVGGQTAQALREWGIEPELVASTEQSARGLAADWPVFDDVEGFNKVLLPRADIATEVLVSGLIDKGWDVDDVTAYRTVRAAPPPASTREAIKRGDFDAVLFTSSSTVRNLVGIAGKPPATTVVACIGPATAQTAQEHGLTVDVVAGEANLNRLIEDLAEFARQRRDAAAARGETALRPSQMRGRRRKNRKVES